MRVLSCKRCWDCVVLTNPLTPASQEFFIKHGEKRCKDRPRDDAHDDLVAVLVSAPCTLSH